MFSTILYGPYRRVLNMELREIKWDDEWILTCKKLVQEELERSYWDFTPAAFDKGTEKSDGDDDNVEDSRGKKNSKDSKKKLNIFDETNDTASETSEEPASSLNQELELYLSTKADKNIADPIRWWIEKRQSYPRLSRMAIDYLTIPGTSVDVERLFSRGRLILSHTRSRLNVTSTRALLCLGSWSLLGLVRDEDLTEVGKLDEIDGKIELERVANVLRGSDLV